MSAPRDARWRQAARGIALAGFGVFLLLTTQGVLPWSFWLEAATFWPVLLVALGLRLLLERAIGAWTALLSPALVLGTLSFVALREPPRPRLPPDAEWRRVEAARPDGTDSWVLDATLALSRIELRAGEVAGGGLVEGRALSQRAGSVHVGERGAAPRVRIRSRSRPQLTLTWRMRVREAWELSVADDLPLRADLELAFVEGSIDLSGAPVTRLELEGGFNDVAVSLGAPAQQTRIDLEGAFNELTLVVPEGTAVRVETDGLFNLVDERARGSRGEGPGYRVRLEGAFNTLTVRSR